MKILLCSPVSFSLSKESGIHIRIKGIANYFKKSGHTVKITDKYNENLIKKYDLIYCLVSTKRESITYQTAKNVSQHKKRLVLDLYTPILLEKDLSYSAFNPFSYLNRKNQISVIRKLLAASDFFIVANGRQKKYWLETSKTLRQTIKSDSIAIIPTGYASPKNLKRQPGKIILWFGGIYPWLDPTPLARAFAAIAADFPAWKLRITGGYHPDTGYKTIFNKFTNELNKLSRKQIEIIPWLKPQELPKYLKDVSFAVHLPKQTPEDYFAHRVRLLTLTNFGIPVATSGRDLISKHICDLNAGIKVSNSLTNLKNQLLELMKNPKSINVMQKNTKKIQDYLLKNELNDRIFRQ